MKAYIFPIILVLTVLLSSCTASSLKQTDPLEVTTQEATSYEAIVQETTSPNETSSYPESQGQELPTVTDMLGDIESEDTMEKILTDLVAKNYTCITELFYFGNLPYGQVEMQGDVPVARVTSSRYNSLEDLRTYLYGIYTREEADRLINNYFDDRPLYFEKEGKLYLNVDQTTAAGIPIPWDSFEIKISACDANVCTFVAEVTYIEDAKIEEKGIYSFEAVNSDGWRLKTIVKNPSA